MRKFEFLRRQTSPSCSD